MSLTCKVLDILYIQFLFLDEWINIEYRALQFDHWDPT